MSNEVDVQDIIQRLGKRIAELEVSTAIQSAQIDALQAQLAEHESGD